MYRKRKSQIQAQQNQLHHKTFGYSVRYGTGTKKERMSEHFEI